MFLVAGCAADSDVTSPEALLAASREASLQVIPDVMCPLPPCGANVPAGDSIHFRASRVSDVGREVEVTRPQWSIADTSIATVSADGWVIGKRPGETEVSATQGPLSGSATVRVVAARMVTVRVTATDTVLPLGATTVLRATSIDALNQEHPDAPVFWFSRNPDVATVDEQGVVHAVRDGHVIITAHGVDNVVGWIGLHTGSGVPAATGFRLADQAVGTTHACGITEGGAAYCWGWNFYGQLGTGAPNDEAAYFGTPQRVVKAPPFVRMAPGHYHSCALTSEGAAYCWGLNEAGRLGLGKEGGILPVPGPVAGGIVFEDVSAGGDHTCGLEVGGQAYCWGANYFGQMGTGGSTTDAYPEPVPIASNVRFTTLRAGLYHVCGLDAQGQAYCWGGNFLGQLGTGRMGKNENVPQTLRPSIPFAAIETGSSSQHTCALSTAGEAYCWGRNDSGQVGDGTFEDRARPVAVNTTQRFRSLALGAHHTCALTDDGIAYCWGNNEYGQLADRTVENLRPDVRPVTTDLRFVSLSAANNVTCGRTNDGATYCWGSNGQAVLGAGFELGESLSAIPLPVVTP